MRALRAAKVTELEAVGVDAVSEARDLNDEEGSRFAALTAEIRTIDERIDALEAIEARTAAHAAKVVELGHQTPAVVTSEARTYGKGSRNSFFNDLHNARLNGDMDAAQRLHRHMAEERALVADGTPGNGAELLVPTYLTDPIVPNRFTSVLRGLATQDDLPAGVSQVIEPKITIADVAGDVAIGGTPAETDLGTLTVPSTVHTDAAGVTLPISLLQLSPIKFDEAIMRDLNLQLGLRLARRAIADVLGAGFETVSVSATTFSAVSSAMTAAELKVYKGRKQRANAVVVSADVWGWLLDQSDTTGRPLVSAVPGDWAQGLVANGNGVESGLVGRTRTGLPIYLEPLLDEADGKQRIVVGKFDDAIARQGDIFSRVVPLVNMAQTLQGYTYSSFISKRQDSSFVVIEGAGLDAIVAAG